MKKYISTIAVLTACSLGLVQPICAQEGQEETQSLSQETLAFYDSWARELMAACKEIKEALSTVTDKDSADAAAPVVCAATKRLDAMVDEISARDDYSDAIDEYLNKHYPEGKGCVDGIRELIGDLEDVDFYGSHALESAVMGEQAPSGPEIDDIIDETREAIQALIDALINVRDTASADAAVPAAKAAFARIRQCKDTINSILMADSDFLKIADILDNGNGTLEKIFIGLEGNGYYGSSDLKNVFAHISDDAAEELTEEELAFYDGLVAQYTAKAQELLAILQGVKDKESADAAAEKAKPISDEMWTIAENIQKHGGTSTLEKRYKNVISLAEKLEDLGDKFMKQDFFGSDPLKAIFILTAEDVEDKDGE